MRIEELDDFTKGYVVCALWSSNDESTPQGGEPLDKNYDVDDIADEAIQQMITDCATFQEDNQDTLDAAFDSHKYRRVPDSTPLETAGHDFWLTRDGHGCGFWGGDYPKREGELLTKASEAFGSCDLYVGYGGKIYIL